MTTNKGGRPAKYPYEILFSELIKFANENPMGKITYSSLAKSTNIPRHVWRDNKEIQSDIERLNNEPLSITKQSDDLTELPNIVDIVEKHYSNKKALIASLREYMDYLEHLNENASKNDKENISLREKVEKLENENRISKEANEVYKNQLKEVAVRSATSKGRKELGINKNIISINENIKKAGATIRDINEEFQDLFD